MRAGDLKCPFKKGDLIHTFRVQRTHTSYFSYVLICDEELAPGNKVVLKTPREREIFALFREEIELWRTLTRMKARSAERHLAESVADCLIALEMDGRPFAVIEYVEGSTLHQLLEAEPKRKLSISQVLAAAIQFCNGMIFIGSMIRRDSDAHYVGFAHRDICPDNIMMTWVYEGEDARPLLKIIDFGLAKAVSRTPAPSHAWSVAFAGRLVYGAPECFAGSYRATATSDVYSFGVTMWELLTGRPPFEREAGESDEELMARIRTEELPEFRKLRPDAPPELERVLARCLEKDPSKRYADFGALLKDLLPLHARAEQRAILPAERELCSNCGYIPYQPTALSYCPLCGEPWEKVRRERPVQVVAPEPPARLAREALKGEFVSVPGGQFTAGCPAAESQRYPLTEEGQDLLRERAVEIGPFRIGRYPVTNEEYLVFVRAAGHPRPSHWRPNLDDPYPKDIAQHPVVNVSWEDANAYCRWRGCRLPTRDEWEKAAGWDASARVKRRYPWGEGFSPERCNTAEAGRRGTVPVEEFSQYASPCGAVQMVGNVWEWIDGGQGDSRFIRGSSFKEDGEEHGQVFLNVVSAPQGMRADNIGFRCVDDESGVWGQMRYRGPGSPVRPGDEDRPWTDEELWQHLSGERGAVVAISAGPFQKGCTPQMADEIVAKGGFDPRIREVLLRAKAERASVSSFGIGRYPVTNLEYWQFVRATRHRAPEHWNPVDWEEAERDPCYRPFWRFISLHPVTRVSLEDARAFCRWKGGRLPSAVEWERAARGPESCLWPWGREFDAGRCNSLSAWWARTTPVYQYPTGASPEGVVDLVGNAYEWLEDGDLRGGSWRSQCEAFGLTFASLMVFAPQETFDHVGFRYVI